MKQTFGDRLLRLLILVLVTAPFIAVWLLYYHDLTTTFFYYRANLAVYAAFVAVYLYLSTVYDGYSIEISKITEIVYSQILSAFIADVLMYILFIYLFKDFSNPLPLLAAFAVQAVLIIFWAFVANKYITKRYPARKTLVIYDARRGIENDIMKSAISLKFRVEKVVSISEYHEKHDELLSGCNAVFLSGIHSADKTEILKYCVMHKINVFLLPKVGDILVTGAKPVHILHLPILEVKGYDPSIEYLIIKRLFDIVVSLLFLIVFSPFWLIIAICIKLEDHGPVLYKQTRLTKNGRYFKVIKFRSMRVDAECDGVARLSTGTSDMRVTRTGRILRMLHLDEVPQFINILKGEMSFIGPRPERPEIAAEYEEHIPEFELRLQTKAGLTGLAQVYGKYNTSPYDKLVLDLMYIAKHGILEDMRILLATIKIIFIPESSEGIAEGKITAE